MNQGMTILSNIDVKRTIPTTPTVGSKSSPTISCERYKISYIKKKGKSDKTNAQ
jgi:hypothetical protein